MSPTDTTNGFFSFNSASSCQIRSLASADPPGESMRSTTTLTESSFFRRRMVLVIALALMPPLDSTPPDSIVISPSAGNTAMCARPPERLSAPARMRISWARSRPPPWTSGPNTGVRRAAFPRFSASLMASDS